MSKLNEFTISADPRNVDACDRRRYAMMVNMGSDGRRTLPDRETPVDRGGRPASTSAHELAAQAQRLFVENGFDRTSVEDIAATVGVSRRTFFRYFPTKADVIWVESEAEHALFEQLLDHSPSHQSPWAAITAAYIATLDHGRAEDDWARHRARLILYEPAVQPQANQVVRRWRTTVTRFVANRRGCDVEDVAARAAGHAAIAASIAAHEHWLVHPELSIAECMRTLFDALAPRGLEP
ncbi:TetR family transcriptional regulator [Gordonia otitidis]|mgnify:CR=1 FL=1|uniref:TetR family transcriptional regulator n=2 Tax=Gordonia otitidis TaxID=249058 RepID=H5TK01_GORO1|nr:TetR family transcriptional regulator [Gordonia otitidis]GAB33809.1 putative TetR family transcriptional regulator [Gordonia otitidis NBRC 100426]